MNEILIPHEGSNKKKQNTKKKQTLRQSLNLKIDAKKLTDDKKLMKNTCIKVIDYLSNEGNFDVSEIKCLENDLQRTIMIIQKRKMFYHKK